MLRLKEFRKAEGMNVAQLADELSVKPDTYRKWESETNAIPLEKTCVCADILHCTLDELAGHKKATLSEEEICLLGLNRSTDDRGRAAITAVAAIMAVAESQRENEGKSQSGVSESA